MYKVQEKTSYVCKPIVTHGCDTHGCEHSKSGAESHVNHHYLTVDDTYEQVQELHTQNSNATKMAKMHERKAFPCN